MSQQQIPRAHPREIQDSDVLAAIVSFVERNRQQIWLQTGMKGGWEGWLQAELADFIPQSSPYFVEREQAVFQDTRQSIDLWCKHRMEYYDPYTNPNPSERYMRIGVELKCGGEYQDFFSNTVASFQGRVISDINKIIAGMNTGLTGQSGARVYAVGVTADFTDLYGFESVARTGMQVRYWQSPPLQNTDSLYVLWWYRDFP
ncbi:hypothetical protein CNMCM8980_007414 [Aspergillus fumigatiaffinis]|jgi:hypothetical protein|uniref:Uncharacterized protein n=1 Tax=Aspergillus fumigatiaffinis TaxID=340414 RepID=A0A8H4M7W1_9EURO|nr:hypothetical protein CNMCM5878_000272 [Aspergillus fumigatiaffinis]KAF4232227.1 hypothetical protein CNMCM6805_010063 [Aspergillus fumigatiaffinis]KAF4247372.1 hypothetical protein CNMCM8980_007414 [Aspergillus fumigatiaffinis]